MAGDQESVDARFRDFMRTQDAKDVIINAMASVLGCDGVSDTPRPGTYLHHVYQLRARYDAGELTEEQFRAEMVNLRPMLQENIRKAESGE